MKTKNILNISRIFIIALFVMSILTLAFVSLTANAEGDCAGVKVSYLDALCGGGNGGGSNGGDIENSGLWQILTGILNIMLAGVGVLAVGGIVYGAILYSSAADNAQQVEQAKTIFRNVVIGLVSFALMYSLLQFLIPGGIFN